MIFPGFSLGNFPVRGKQGVAIHHITIRENKDGRLIAYPRPPRHGPRSQEKSGQKHALPASEDYELVHLCSFFVDSPNKLFPAGIPYRRIPTAIGELIQERGYLSEQPVAANHFHGPLNYPDEFPRPNHLQVSFALSKEPPDDPRRIVWEMLDADPPSTEWDGNLPGMTAATSLRNVFPDHPFQWLVAIAFVIPGERPMPLGISPEPFGLER